MNESDNSYEALVFDPTVLAGVWADSTRVHLGRDALTVDFIRDVPDPPGRVLVARAIVSPFVGAQLGDQLNEAWRSYYRWSMPGDADDG